MFALRRRWQNVKFRWQFAALGLAACVILALLLAPSVVRRVVQSKAQARGLALNVDSVGLGVGRLWLRDVVVAPGQWGRFSARLPSVEVRYGLSGVTEIVAHGGVIEVQQNLAELLEQWRKLRASKSPQGDAAGGQRKLRAEGLHIHWQLGGGTLLAWGVHLEREGGNWQLASDLLRYHSAQLEAESRDLHVAVALPAAVLNSVRAAHTQLTLRQGALSEPTPTTQATAQPAPAAGAQPPTSAVGLPPSAGRGERLRAAVDRAAQLLAARLPANGKVELDNLHVALLSHTSQLNLGPLRLAVAHTPQALSVSLTQGASAAAGPGLALELEAPLQPGPVALLAHAGPMPLALLGVREGDLGLVQPQRAQLRLELAAELAATGASAKLATSGELRDVSWLHPKVAPEALRDMHLSWDSKAEVALDGSRLQLLPSTLGFGAVRMLAQLQVEQTPGRVRVAGDMQVSRAACQAMFDSLPLALVPLLQGTRFSGEFTWRTALEVDTDNLSKAKVDWNMQNGCRLSRVPPNADPEQFRAPFTLSVNDAQAEPRAFLTGPGTQQWVGLPEISQYLSLAVLTTEDAGFWQHRGFDQGAIESSIKSNLQAGKFVRGASTISMQLAKNLFLSRDKLLSRKVQEALLTMLLEQELTKAEILELYFNVIEFGPDVYGVRAAAQHYFNAEPHELSLAQAFFLASILPRPQAEHFESDGKMVPAWQELVRRLMRIAHERGRISEAELKHGVAEEVQFGVPFLWPEEAAGTGDPAVEGELGAERNR